MQAIGRCFPVNFEKFLRTPFLQNTSGRLLLPVVESFFGKFSIGKSNNCFFQLFWLFPILWQASISLDITSTPILETTKATFSSGEVCSTESGLPDISILLLLPFFSSIFWLVSRDRSSRLEVFCKKGVLNNFAKYTGKHLCQSLFF